MNLSNPLHLSEEAHKWGFHPGFETQGGRHRKSKIGVSVQPQKGLMYTKKMFLKKRKKEINLKSINRKYSLFLPEIRQVNPVTQILTSSGVLAIRSIVS